MIRILIADDHAMVRQGLCQLLNSVPDFSVIGQACDGCEAVYLCELLQPDIVVMDLAMPNMDGLTAIRLIRSHNAYVRIIILSAFSDETQPEEALLAEIEVVLSKHASIYEILDTVHAVARSG